MSKSILVIPQGSYQTVAQPRYVSLLTDDTYAVITAAGYLNKLQNGNDILVGDLISALYDTGINGLFTVSKSAGVLTMAPLSGAGEVSFTGPASTANALAVFSDVLGNIKAQSVASTLGFGLTITTGDFAVSAGTITGSGAIQSLTGNVIAGSSTNPASFVSFPASAANGTFIFSALNAGGAFNTTLRNSVMGQSSVISLPDPGAATALVLLSSLTGAGVQHITSGGLQVDGGSLLAGLAAGGTAGSFTMYPATTANGTFKFSAVNAGGAFNTEVRNGVMGQSTVYTIPDAANALGRFLVGATATPFVSGEFPVASGTGGLMVSSGLAAANIQNKTNIIAARTADIGGGGAGPISVVVAGMTAASVITASIQTSSNVVSISKVTATATGFDILFSADPGAACTVNYHSFIAAQ